VQVLQKGGEEKGKTVKLPPTASSWEKREKGIFYPLKKERKKKKGKKGSRLSSDEKHKSKKKGPI